MSAATNAERQPIHRAAQGAGPSVTRVEQLSEIGRGDDASGNKRVTAARMRNAYTPAPREPAPTPAAGPTHAEVAPALSRKVKKTRRVENTATSVAFSASQPEPPYRSSRSLHSNIAGFSKHFELFSAAAPGSATRRRRGPPNRHQHGEGAALGRAAAPLKEADELRRFDNSNPATSGFECR